ncbi:hypothetical protein JXR93_04870 [bacterium]|nr:hypothetical protein [bacterium]
MKNIIFLFSFFFSIVAFSEADYISVIEKAESNFEYGKYSNTISDLENFLTKNKKTLTSLEMIRVYRMLAISNFYLKNLDNSALYIKRIFFIQSDFQFDPVMVSPEFIEFTKKILKIYKDEIEKNRIFLDEYKKFKNPTKYKKKSKKKEFYINFIPFGFGQFQNGHNYKGYFVMTLESIFLLTNLASYTLLKYNQKDDYTFDNSELARTGVLINNVSFFSFILIYIYGTIDGVVYYRAVENIKVLQSNRFNIYPVISTEQKAVFFEWRF